MDPTTQFVDVTEDKPSLKDMIPLINDIEVAVNVELTKYTADVEDLLKLVLARVIARVTNSNAEYLSKCCNFKMIGDKFVKFKQSRSHHHCRCLRCGKLELKTFEAHQTKNILNFIRTTEMCQLFVDVTDDIDVGHRLFKYFIEYF